MEYGEVDNNQQELVYTLCIISYIPDTATKFYREVHQESCVTFGHTSKGEGGGLGTGAALSPAHVTLASI